MYILANFAAYGLNKYKNFLPYTSYDGDLLNAHDNTLYIDEDIFEDTMAHTLTTDADVYSAIFTIDRHGHWAAYIYDERGVSIVECRLDENENLFALLDAEYNFFEYGLLIEIAPNLWKIVGE